MKILKNVLSDSLYQKCLDTLKQLASNQSWFSSSVTWHPELKQGIQGSCIFTFVPEHLKIKILDELKCYLSSSEPMLQFYIWQPLSGIAWHNDDGHNIGATIYLNEKWHVNNGGIFLHQTKDRINALVPQKNTIVINDSNEYHMVTPVAFDVPEYRYTIQIWG